MGISGRIANLEAYKSDHKSRVLDCIRSEYAGLRAALGERRFMKLAESCLEKYQPGSFTASNCGLRLEKTIKESQPWGKHHAVILDLMRFERALAATIYGAQKPIVRINELLGADATETRLGLQPYIALLELDYAVDDFLLAVEKSYHVLSEARSGKSLASKIQGANKPLLPPRAKRLLAVYRHDGVVYYQQLSREAYALLLALRDGATVRQACNHALKEASNAKDWRAETQGWFHNWSSLGWFCHRKTIAG